MKILLLTALLLSGCTEPLLREGHYRATITYTHDDWPHSLVGRTSEASWLINEKAGEYRLRVLDTRTDVKGREIGYIIRFEKSITSPLCGGVSTFTVDVHPKKNREKFSGHTETYVALCQGGGLWTRADFVGELVD